MFEVKKQLEWSKMKVGFVITVALLCLLVAVFFAGNIQDILTQKAEIKAQIPDLNGLRKGAPVWIFGLEVGFVRNIHLSPQYGPIVTMEVKKDVLRFIKQDSQASIQTMGLLGDKFVEIGAGSPSAGPIQRGGMIKGKTQVELQDVIATSVSTINKTTEFIGRLDDFLTKIETGQGTIAKFITDPTIYNNLSKTTSVLLATLQEIRDSKGTLKMVLEDPSFYNKMVAAAANLEELTRTVKESSGTLRKLIEDPSLYEKMSASASHVEGFSKRLEEFASKIAEARGTFNKLVEDPELYENLNRGSKLLSSILERIDKGEGTLGSVVRSDELYKGFSQALLEFRKLNEELETLLKDIRQNPKRYFKFSVF
jgi:phospholipid/cholesterol/gamma-HCH transport system substrate-binding protein